MKYIIYPESAEKECFRDFSYNYAINMTKGKDFIGGYVLYENDTDFKEELIDLIAEHIVETYLDGCIITMIYDEYPYIEIEDVPFIVSEFTQRFKQSGVREKIFDTITKCGKICLKSFILFYNNLIMLTANSLIKEICEIFLESRTRQDFLELVRAYNAIFYDIDKKDLHLQSENMITTE